MKFSVRAGLCAHAATAAIATLQLRVLGAAAILVLSTACSPGEPAKSDPKAIAAAPANGGAIVVSAAASLRDVMTTIATRYEESHPGARVALNFGASNMLGRQIVEGGPADAVFLADARSMDAVADSGRLEVGTRIDLLSNALVVIVPADRSTAMKAPPDLLSPGVARIALCDDAVPIGHYARSWLSSRGLLAPIASRIVRPDDARATLVMVASGGADAGIVYRTDAKGAKGVRVALEVPPEETPGIVYPAAALRDGPNPAGGKSFLEFASTPPAIWLFRDGGFVVLTKP